jgi:hypothetical protein
MQPLVSWGYFLFLLQTAFLERRKIRSTFSGKRKKGGKDNKK